VSAPESDPVDQAVRESVGDLVGQAVHDLNNRLAVMRETLGLLEDLARAGRSGAAGTARAHVSLDEQVGRTLNLVQALGGLGGALGASQRAFDAGAAVAELLALSERWARRLSLRLERQIADNLPAATGDPAVFLCLVHRLLVRCAGGGDAASGICVRVEKAGTGIAVRLVPMGARDRGSAAPAADEEEIDRELAARLGGGLTRAGESAATLRLTAIR